MIHRVARLPLTNVQDSANSATQSETPVSPFALRWGKAVQKQKRRLCAGASPRIYWALGGSGDRSALAIRGIDEIPQLLAGFEERNFLCRHFNLSARLGIAPHAPAPLPRTKAAKTANLDLLALLQR